MTTTYNCTSEDQRALGLEHAQRAISEKKCVVFPTDTVYGIAADAFSPQAVTMLLVSKGRSRSHAAARAHSAASMPWTGWPRMFPQMPASWRRRSGRAD